METLLDIAKVVTAKQNGRRLSDTVIVDGNDSIFSGYLRKVLDQAYRSDDEAARDIYGSDHNDQRYRTLKSRAFDRLLQALLLLEIRRPAHSEYQTSYHRCARNVVAARLLMSFASRRTGTKIAEKSIVIARRYQFTELALDLLILLRESYSIFLDRKAHQECTEQIKHYLALLRAELRSDELLDKMQLMTRSVKSVEESVITAAREWYAEHSTIAASYTSHKIVLNQYRFSIVYHGLIRDLAEVNDACDGARAYLASNPHISQPTRIGAFGLLKIRASIMNRQAQLVTSEIDDVVQHFSDGSNDWFVAIEYGVLALLQAADYQRAFQLWYRGRLHKNRITANPYIQETWHLLDAYVHLLIQLELIRPPADFTDGFRISTFLNSVPDFSKDKDGYNAHILVAHVFFLILDQNYDVAERRIEHLRVYASRYLKSSNDGAIRLFIKLLGRLARASFKPSRMSPNSAAILDELKTSLPQDVIGSPNEIVPLVALYHQLLIVLEKR